MAPRLGTTVLSISTCKCSEGKKEDFLSEKREKLGKRN